MELVINKCYGGFGLSHEGVMHYAKLAGIKLYAYHRDYTTGTVRKFKKSDSDDMRVFYSTSDDINKAEKNENFWYVNSKVSRDDPYLVQTVKDLGKKANGQCADLKVIEIPDGIQWEIDEYDGIESVHEIHRTWG